MDNKRFDELTRYLAAPRTRRGVLGAIGAAIATAFAGGRAALADPKADKPSKCYGEGSHCTNGKQCCSGTCTNRQCSAPVVECLFPTDCPGSDTDCRVRACVEGACGFENRPLGSPVNVQSPGDCHKDICDGQGGVVTIIDDSDLPDDGNVCTTGSCVGGVPSHTPAIDGGPCPLNETDTGMCVAGVCEEVCADRTCTGSECAVNNETCCPEDDTFGTCTGSDNLNCYCVTTAEGTKHCHEGGQACNEFGACADSSTCPAGTFCSADPSVCSGMCMRGCNPAAAVAVGALDAAASLVVEAFGVASLRSPVR